MFPRVLVIVITIQAFPVTLSGVHWRLSLNLGSLSKYRDSYTGSQELSQTLVPAFKAMEQGLNELHDTLQANTNHDLLARVVITGIFFMIVILALLSRFNIISQLKKTKQSSTIAFPQNSQPGYPGWVNKV